MFHFINFIVFWFISSFWIWCRRKAYRDDRKWGWEGGWHGAHVLPTELLECPMLYLLNEHTRSCSVNSTIIMLLTPPSLASLPPSQEMVGMSCGCINRPSCLVYHILMWKRMERLICTRVSIKAVFILLSRESLHSWKDTFCVKLDCLCSGQTWKTVDRSANAGPVYCFSPTMQLSHWVIITVGSLSDYMQLLWSHKVDLCYFFAVVLPKYTH